MTKITKDQVTTGYRSGVVQLVTDPNMETGTVCQIGEHWFYFGGITAEAEFPEEYQKHVPETDIIREILETLDAFQTDGFMDEYMYYYHVLSEAGC